MKDIITTHNIIEKVAKELKLPVKKVELVYDSLLKYFRHLVLKTDTTAIKLPYIGVLHVKIGALKYKISKRKARKEGLDVAQSKVDKIEAHVEDFNAVNKANAKFIINRHYQKNKLSSKYFTGKLSIQEIETKQNEED